MKNIQKLIEAEKHRAISNNFYLILGHFGDRLSDDIKDEIRQMAVDEANKSNKCETIVKNQLI